MNSALVTAIAALGLAATIQYFLGTKKNRWLGKRMSAQAEDVFSPKESTYVNIGGAIGYNFVYKLREPWKEIKGTFTLFPRHSLLYMPFSLAIGGADRFYLNIFTDKKLAGEGHIVSKPHLRKAKIEGLESMDKEEATLGGRTFLLAWENDEVKAALQKTLEAMPDPASLAHFCCFAKNKTFFLYLKPAKGEISANLKAFTDSCPRFFR